MFVERLRQHLALADCNVYVDKHEILPGEEWRDRLSKLIERSDTVVCCISAQYVASEMCRWEVKKSAALKKRLLPVIIGTVPVDTIPSELGELNFIFLEDVEAFEAGVAQIVDAIGTDIDWIRLHTTWTERVARWEARNRDRDTLSQGAELAELLRFLAKSEQEKLTPELLAYAQASEAEERRRARVRRRLGIAIGLLAMLGSVAVLGWWQQDWLWRNLYWQITMQPNDSFGKSADDKLRVSGLQFADCMNGCPALVVVKPGRYERGSTEPRFPREKPVKSVNIGYWLAVGKTEVTFEQWGHCVASGRCDLLSDKGWGRGLQPVIGVSWRQAQAYVKWLSETSGHRYRLPTEAEWEYFARGGSTEHFSFGKRAQDLGSNAWFAGNANGRPHEVGAKPINNFGLHDVHGNVAEWTADCASDTYNSAPVDGSANTRGNCTSRVFRGGSWDHWPRMSRAATRDWLTDADRKDYIGFRVVREIE